jgi:hypothetical protein
MSDKFFERSLSATAISLLVLLAAGISMAFMRIPWIGNDQAAFVLLVVSLVLGFLLFIGGILLYYWGKNYMARDI